MLPHRASITVYLSAILVALGIMGCGGGGGSAPPPPKLPPFFVLSASPSPFAVPPGESTSIDVTLKPKNGFTGNVAVTITGLPEGLTTDPALPCDMTTHGEAATQRVTFSAAPGSAQGTYMISLTGTKENLNSSITLKLFVGPYDDFFLRLETPQLVVRVGSSGQADISTLTWGEIGGYTIDCAVSGLPAGTTGTFSPDPVSPGDQTALTVTAAASAPSAQDVPVTITCTRSVDSLQRTVTMYLTVAPQVGQLGTNRSDFIRLDGVLMAGVYDPLHQLAFISNISWNRVDVVSLPEKKVVKSISVPSPWGMDLSLDGSKLIVGTRTPNLYTIDTSSLEVVRREYVPDPDNPDNQFIREYTTAMPRVLKNGKILIVSLSPADSEAHLLSYDPASGTVELPTLPFTPNGIPYRSADGAKVILYDGGSRGSVAVYDAETGRFTHRDFDWYVTVAGISPDGQQCLIAGGGYPFSVFDSGLNFLGSVPGGDVGGGLAGAVYNLNGSSLYVVINSNFVPTVVTVDPNNLDLLGTAPALPIIPPYVTQDPSFTVSTPFGVDNTGLVFGITDHGLAIEDASFFQHFNIVEGTPTMAKYLTPNFGPLNTNTTVTFGYAWLNTLPDVWFGTLRGLDPFLEPSDYGLLNVTAPASSRAGPVNVKANFPTGIQVFDPLAFSYGPNPMFLAGSAASPAGGAIIELLATGIPPDPAQVQVSIGGARATLIGASQVVYGPFPTVRLKVKVPAGATGTADVTVTTTDGSATLPHAFQYVSRVANYPSSDNLLTVYHDRFRNRLYLSAGDHIDVFSLDSRAFSSPFQPPTANGRRLFAGMALTPDGSRLLIANNADGSVAIVNPDNPANATAVLVSETGNNPSCWGGPVYIAPTSDGRAFVNLGCVDAASDFWNGIKVLNLTTLQADWADTNAVCGIENLASSGDGKFVAISGELGLCMFDVERNVWSSAPNYTRGAAAAADGNVFAGVWYLYDSQAHIKSRLALPEAHFLDTPYIAQYANVFGLRQAKLNDSGSLLFVPWPNFIDVFDVLHSTPIQRIALTQTVRDVVDALAIDAEGRQLYLITDAGLTIVESEAAPLAIGSLDPVSGPAGTIVSLRGSGFTEATEVRVGGIEAAVTFEDDSTLEVSVPLMDRGPARLDVQNPDGRTYTLDAAFVAE